VVIKAEDDVFMLQWRDWPKLPVFTHRSWQLALPPPGHRA
jgi:hypothetical protein